MWHEIWNDYFRISCFIKEIIFAKRWTRYDIELFSSRLYHQKNRIRCIVDLRIFFRFTICSKLDHLFVNIKRLSRYKVRMTIRINRIDWIVLSEKLNLSCYWLLDTFSLYDLIWICCTTCSRLEYIYFFVNVNVL